MASVAAFRALILFCGAMAAWAALPRKRAFLTHKAVGRVVSKSRSLWVLDHVQVVADGEIDVVKGADADEFALSAAVFDLPARMRPVL